MAVIVDDLERIETPLKNPVLTIGNFDGVHRGHLALFKKVKTRAAAIKGQSVVMTFDPHPIKIMMPENGPPLITPTPQKIKLIENAGIDLILCVPFTKKFAAISAEDFVRTVLVKKIGIKELVVGYDYSFGRHREGKIDLLKKMGAELGFTVHVVGPYKIQGTLVSSTSIRNLVKEGDLAEARKLLGRNYQICGTVIKGQNRGGRLLGFPTANLELIDELSPGAGVYAVEVLINNATYFGVTNIGYNPTFGVHPLSIETHLLDFSGDLLGKTIRVNFIKRLRDEKTFKTIEDLADQIGRDISNAKELFKKIKKSK